ncbi:polyphenol oxidase family protein [Patescibacteria group bacterium]|nr:polyphenol oxidase family protein [Patescibacteria group bacterium]
MSEKKDGSMGRAKERERTRIFKNRQVFFKRNKIDPKKAVMAQLQHGNRVGIVKATGIGTYPAVDGLVTEMGGVCLCVTAADCGIVYFYEQDSRVIGICHAGWRGIASGIVLETVKKMGLLGADAGKIKAMISPMIGKCCFKTKKDTADIFISLGFLKNVVRRKKEIFVDLAGVIRRQSLESGIKAENLKIHKDCTCCKNDKYFSYRAGRGKLKGVMIGGIRQKIR